MEEQTTRARLCAVAVMAKASRVRRSKTRLRPPLTADEASWLSAAFVQDITANLAFATRDAPLVPYVAFAPAGTEALFDGLLAPGPQLILAEAIAEVEAVGRTQGVSLDASGATEPGLSLKKQSDDGPWSLCRPPGP